MEKKKGLIISVGGTIAPIVYSIEKLKPQYIIFFASKESEVQITEILEKSKHKPAYIDKIITESAEALDYCIKAINENITRILKNWGIELKDFVVDYTGGTKTMSAALVLLTIEECSHYSYIGGIERDKGGLGVVLNGRERMLYLKNPWDEMAMVERRRINLLFNRGRYKTCLEILEKVIEKVNESEKPFYLMLKDLIEGYYHWNRCDIKLGNQFLSKAQRSLEFYSTGSSNPYFRGLLARVQENTEFLRRILNGEKALIIYDLIASAKRCAELENKYDDAVARLYRALEKGAQNELENSGIKHNDVKPDEIPETIRNEYIRRYSDDNGRIRLPLTACYRLLKERNNELGTKYFKPENKLHSLLEKRNLSKLAHGDKSLSEDDYRAMFEEVCSFLDIKEKELPQFPEMNI